MKKLIYMGTVALIAASSIFWSCQKDEFVNDAENASMLKKAKIMNVTSTVDWAKPVCAGSEHTFTLQGWTGTKNIGVQIYDESISEWIPVKGLPVGQVSGPRNFVYTFPADGTYKLRYSVSGNATDGGTNGQKEFAVDVINCGCDESFGYVENADGSYTFTYIPAEDMDNAQLVFTFAQGVAVDGLNNWTQQGSTRQNTMKLIACQTYSWTVRLNPDCSGNSNNSNVWTDFKVAPADKDINAVDDSGEKIYSKKGTLSNIVIKCP